MSEVPSLIDTHAHIDGKEFDGDFSDMLARAAAAGVSRIIAVGGDIESSRKTVQLARSYDNIHCAVGIHPHDAIRVSDKCFDLIGQMASEAPRCVAIGEIGLDFFRDRSPRDIQERVFRRFLILAAELNLPVIIHDRDAHDRILSILREERSRGIRGVLHCFSGDLEMARECIGLGFFVSIPGTVTYPSNQKLRDVVGGVSSDFILLETDCPYLSPVPHRGKRNEPSYLRLVAEKSRRTQGTFRWKISPGSPPSTRNGSSASGGRNRAAPLPIASATPSTSTSPTAAPTGALSAPNSPIFSSRGTS